MDFLDIAANFTILLFGLIALTYAFFAIRNALSWLIGWIIAEWKARH